MLAMGSNTKKEEIVYKHKDEEYWISKSQQNKENI